MNNKTTNIMNREILFRGLKADGQFTYGHLLCDTAIGKWGHAEYFTYCDVDPLTVGEYVNKNDILGTKIFTGDRLVLANGQEITVIYKNGCYCGRNRNKTTSYTYHYWDSAKVIGNIHQK